MDLHFLRLSRAARETSTSVGLTVPNFEPELSDFQVAEPN